MANSGLGLVTELPLGGSAVNIGSGFSKPTGVAADAAGNVYVADVNNSAIYKNQAVGGSTVSIGTVFLNPTGVAVDAAGNVYVADNGNNACRKDAAVRGALRLL